MDADKPLAPMSWAQRLKRVFAIDIETCSFPVDPLQSFGNGIPPSEEEGESDVIPSAIVNVNFPF